MDTIDKKSKEVSGEKSSLKMIERDGAKAAQTDQTIRENIMKMAWLWMQKLKKIRYYFLFTTYT